MSATPAQPSRTICVVGEGMIELSGAAGAWRCHYGGDAINTAVHLARCGERVRFASALGGDPFSDELRAQWQAEGVDTALTLTVPERTAGLYAIRTDAAGERSFFYWREASAARVMFAGSGGDRLAEAIAAADVLYFSLISLAVLCAEGQARLLACCAAVRAAGGLVAFDGNYRPRLWPDAASARRLRDAGIAVTDIGLPTLADEIALAEPDAPAPDAHAVATHWRAGGVGEVAVKLGADGCLVDGTLVPVPAPATPVDTSGAGDAFNAGYLHARLAGLDSRAAAIAGHRLAGWTIGKPGAIPPRSPDAPYDALIDEMKGKRA